MNHITLQEYIDSFPCSDTNRKGAKMRLIDADALRRLVDDEWFDCQEKSSFVDEIDRTPTIDPVEHGKWIKDGEAYALYKCSVCNDLCTVAGYANCIPVEQMYKVFKFCPHCGARMDL